MMVYLGSHQNEGAHFVRTTLRLSYGTGAYDANLLEDNELWLSLSRSAVHSPAPIDAADQA
jgi:hypothetical protein